MTTNKFNLETIENGKVVVIEMTLEDRISYEVGMLSVMTESELIKEYNNTDIEEITTAINEYWKEIA